MLNTATDTVGDLARAGAPGDGGSEECIGGEGPEVGEVGAISVFNVDEWCCGDDHRRGAVFLAQEGDIGLGGAQEGGADHPDMMEDDGFVGYTGCDGENWEVLMGLEEGEAGGVVRGSGEGADDLVGLLVQWGVDGGVGEDIGPLVWPWVRICHGRGWFTERGA